MIFRIVRDGLLGRWQTQYPRSPECSVFRLYDAAGSRVGLTEEQARASGATVRVVVVTLPGGGDPSRRVMNDTRGVLKR